MLHGGLDSMSADGRPDRESDRCKSTRSGPSLWLSHLPKAIVPRSVWSSVLLLSDPDAAEIHWHDGRVALRDCA